MKITQGDDRQDPREQGQQLGDKAAQEAEDEACSNEQENEDVERGQSHACRGNARPPIGEGCDCPCVREPLTSPRVVTGGQR
jgi:hypothetical protein